jgi:isocitrate dehydrogenase
MIKQKDIPTISVAYGDGIGPEIMEATLFILKEAQAALNIEAIEIGEQMYKKGFASGISPEAWESVKRNKIIFKAPITTPQGKGYKSLNVTFRKSLGLFANVRPVTSYPMLAGGCEKMDMVIVRENEEDLYAGIEYRPTCNSALSLKLITPQGSEKIIRYAFEYARNNGRKKVTCMIKDNITKITDGIFHGIFKQVAEEYPDIKTDNIIIDIGAARIASKPEIFDVVVTLNLYGDIISDIAAESSGSVGLAGSANIGAKYAMFEAIHGSAPDIAGQGIANPSGLINGALMMLNHLGQNQVAATIYNAWIRTLEDGIHTADIFNSKKSVRKVSTQEFAKAVVGNLGQLPKSMPALVAKPSKQIHLPEPVGFSHKSELVGVDIYIEYNDTNLEELVQKIQAASANSGLVLEDISQRGIVVWPQGEVENLNQDLWRLRFMAAQASLKQQQSLALQMALDKAGFKIAMAYNLSSYDQMAGFS